MLLPRRYAVLLLQPLVLLYAAVSRAWWRDAGPGEADGRMKREPSGGTAADAAEPRLDTDPSRTILRPRGICEECVEEKAGSH